MELTRIHPAHVAGIFFCLASAEGAGLLFYHAAIRPYTSVYSVFYSVHAVIQPKHKNSLQGFTEAFPLICPIPAHAIQQIHKPTIHRMHHAGGIPSNAAPPAHTRYQLHAGRCTGQHSRHTIIRYIRMQGRAACYGSMPDSAAYCRPCQPVGVSSCRMWIVGKC